MASFFRWNIAKKVIPILLKNNANEKLSKPSVVSKFVEVCRLKGQPPQLFVPWKKITDLSETDNITNPTDLVTRLRNQGLPTAEGFIDITLSQEPLGVVFTVDKHVFSKIVLTDICADDENVARHSCLFQDIPKRNIVVECKVPNIGETFQMVHFRSAIHCNFIANINKLAGHNVIKTRHLADEGLKSAILLTGYKEFGIEKDLLKDPNKHLSEVSKVGRIQFTNDLSFKEKVNHCLENMEKGDQKTLSDWVYLKNLSLKQHDTFYNTIGLNFDDSHFDSSYSAEIKEVGKDLLKRNLINIQEDEKGKFSFESGDEKFSKGKDIDSIVFNLSREIFSCVHKKAKYNFDTLLYITPTSDKTFFSILFPLVEKLGYEWSGCLRHIRLMDISHFEKNRKYSNVEYILEQAKTYLLNKFQSDLHLEIDENIEEMTQSLSLSSLVIHDLKHRRKIDYAFDWKDVLSFGKDSGVSLQYCHAGLKGVQTDSEYLFNLEIDTSPLLERVAHDLIQHLARFDEMVYKSYLQLEPAVLLQYLFSLWYFTDRAANILRLDIKSDRLIVLKARLMLLSATMKVLRKGLHLLGLTPFEAKYSRPDFVKPFCK